MCAAAMPSVAMLHIHWGDGQVAGLVSSRCCQVLGGGVGDGFKITY
jgi:hypothetical protein